jgi:hypothetical protein
MQRVMANPEFLQAAESLGRGLMSQVADPEMAGMMELFSNPDNQAVLKAKMEELKDVSGWLPRLQLQLSFLVRAGQLCLCTDGCGCLSDGRPRLHLATFYLPPLPTGLLTSAASTHVRL